MDAQKLIEAVSMMTEGPVEAIDGCHGGHRIEWEIWTKDGEFQLCAAASRLDAAGFVALRNHAIPIIESLLQRVAELEKDAGRYRWLRNCDDSHGIVQRHLHTGNSWLPGGADLDAAIDAAISNAAPNVRDAGPTPYSGRTTRRDEG